MNSLLLFFSLFFTLTTPQAFSQEKTEGGCGGHGGDGISQEFYQTGNVLYQQLNKIPTSAIAAISKKFKLPYFKTVLDQTHLATSDQPVYVEINHQLIEVDAKNSVEGRFPEITISRKRWTNLPLVTALYSKEEIVLHEYLGIIKGLHPELGEWDEYTVSTELMGLITQYSHLSSIMGETWTSEILAAFESSTTRLSTYSERGTTYSCLEYSLLNRSLPPLVHLNTYNSAMLSSDSFENLQVVTQMNTTIKSEFRMNQRGDLMVKKSDQDNNRPLSILYCSKLGSKAIQMTKFLSESLLPIFETPQTQDFLAYQQKMKVLSESKTYSKCMSTKSIHACVKLYHAIDQIKLKSESTAVIRAKANILQINQWLDGLGDRKTLINQPLLKLYEQYTNHQSNLQNLLDLGDVAYPSTPYSKTADDIGLKNFVDSILNRLPIAYEDAKNEFLVETLRAEEALVESFNIKY